MKYIILTGSDGGYGNLGDEWLLDAVKFQYQKVKNDFHVILLKANIPDINSDGFDYVSDNLSSFKKKGIPINDIAAVHYYGGGYLNDYWMKEKLWLYDYLLDKGLSKDKIFFTSAGIGPIDKNNTVNLCKIIKTAAFFGTRDKSFIDDIGGTFMFDESVVLAKNNSYSNNRSELWVNFRIANHVGADEIKLGILLKQVNFMAKKNELTIKYFAMIKGKNFDEKAEMERVLKFNNINAKVLDRAENYEGLMAQFKNAAMVITTSYHATLASLYMGIPVAAVYENEYYSLKYNGLKEILKTSLLTLINLSKYKKDELFSAFKTRDFCIKWKIIKLKLLNRKFYKKYRKFLDVN